MTYDWHNQDVKIYSFVIANFNRTKISNYKRSTPTHFSHFQEKLHKLVTSLTL